MKYLQLITNSIMTDIKILFRYRKSLISDVITFLAVYLGIVAFSDADIFSNYYHLKSVDGSILLLIGYIFWSFSNISLGYSSSVIVGDAKSGMLEVKLQGIIPYYALVFCSVLVTVLESIIILLIVCLISLGVGLIQFSSIPIIMIATLMTFPSIIGMYGIGLILGGFSLKEKSIGQFVSIISAILLFLSNTLVVNLPNYIYIIPFTSGIDLTRKLFSESLFDVKLFVIYLSVCFLWLFIGIVIFNVFLKRERILGSFDNF